MYRLPILLAILNVLGLSDAGNEAFDEVQAEFDIVGDRVELSKILLLGNVLALKGHGSYSIPDGGVDLLMAYGDPRWLPTIPGLGPLMRELIELHVTGTVARPTIRARPFRALQDEFDRLFQPRKPKKIPPEE